jgi:hypothetical protein
MRYDTSARLPRNASRALCGADPFRSASMADETPPDLDWWPYPNRCAARYDLCVRTCNASCGGNGREDGSESRELRYEDALSGVRVCDWLAELLVGRDEVASEVYDGSDDAAAAAAN